MDTNGRRVDVPADLIVAAMFCCVLVGIGVLSPRRLSFWHASVVLPFCALLVLLVIGAMRTMTARDRSFATLARRSKVLIADWLPLVVGVLVYENVNDLTYMLRPNTVDVALRVLDERLFGITPSLAFDRIMTPWLNEVMSAAYALYFVYPLLILVLTYRRGDLVRFREFSLALSICLYLGLLGFVLVPAIGPRYAFPSEFRAELVGPWLTEPAARAWNLIEQIQRDCFPSLHTALTMLSLIYFVRLRRTLPHGRLLLATVTMPIVLLWVSTMYLRYHYGIDVIAGALLAWGVSRAAPYVDARYRSSRRLRCAVQRV